MFQPKCNPGMPSADESEPAERRAQLRHRCNCSALVLAEGGAVEAQVRNISLRGIGLLLSRQLQPGTLLSVALTEHEHPLAIEARVVHSTQQSRGWLTGCTFIERISEQELEEWLT